jgi:uncharacterized lipoprotein YmbA
MRNSNLLALLALSGMLMSLAACGGKVRYPNYYVLDIRPPVPVASQAQPLLGSVAVRNFAAPSFLRAGPIVYRDSPEQINFYYYHRWAVDPRTAVTNAVLRKMQASGIFQSVNLFDAREPSDYLVTGRLEHLEEVDQGRHVYVEVHLSAQLRDLKSGDVVWNDSCSETTQLERRAVPGVVAQMSQTTEKAVENLVSSMQKRVELLSAQKRGAA